MVCQHGLEGRVRDVADPKIDSGYYHRFAVRLAEEGFVTFAPQNPYIGEDRFVHAPSGSGRVRIDQMNARYYAQRFEAARSYFD